MALEKAPRISANKLGEYMVASFVRQRGIIRDQKRDSKQKSARYSRAEEPVLKFLVDRNVDALHAAAAVLRSAPTGATAWKESDRLSTIRALDALSGLGPQLLQEKWQFAAPPGRPRRLHIAGVDVSVQPHAIVFGTRAKKDVFGALRFHFIQDEEKSLSKRGGEFVAALLHRWCLDHPWQGRVPHPSLSLSVDVFSGAIAAAPERTSKIMANIEAACEDIRLKWSLT